MVIAMGIPLGIGRSGFMLLNNSLLMSNANPSYYGRVMSLGMMGFGSQALLAPVWGVLADNIGVRETLVVVGILAAVVTTLIGLSWIRIRHLAPPVHSALAVVHPAPGPPLRPEPSVPRIASSAPPIGTKVDAAPTSPPPLETGTAGQAESQPQSSSSRSDPPLWRKANIVTALAIGAALGLAAAVGQRNGAEKRDRRPPHSPSQKSDALDALQHRTDTARERFADWVDPPNL